MTREEYKALSRRSRTEARDKMYNLNLSNDAKRFWLSVFSHDPLIARAQRLAAIRSAMWEYRSSPRLIARVWARELKRLLRK